MCELFGLSASHRRSGAELPLTEFQARGGGTADNPDGWGVAWRADGCFRLEKDPEPGCRSARFAAVIAALAADLLVAHVRKARHPPVNTPANTHPFLRQCCGRQWAFAHNGLVPEVVALETANRGRVCQPEGQTDSEFAFCHLLSHATRHARLPAGQAERLALLGGVSEAIARHGMFNFLLSDGEHLVAYGHDRLHYLETAAAGGEAALIATEPLAGPAGWLPFAPGELRIYRGGRLLKRLVTHPPVPDRETGSPPAGPTRADEPVGAAGRQAGRLGAPLSP